MDKAEFIKYYLAPLMWALDPDIEEIRLIDRPSAHQIITIKYQNSVARESIDITNKTNEEIAFDGVMLCLNHLDNKRRNPPLGQA